MPVARSKEERFPFSRWIWKFLLLEKKKDTSNLCSFYATTSENTEAPYTQGSLKKWEKRKVITTQATQTYLRIAYKTCPLVLLWTKLLIATSWQRKLKKTWVHENIAREMKTLLLPFDLVLNLIWQTRNALPCAMICFTFKNSTGLSQGGYFNLIPLALQDHCSYHSSNKLAKESEFNLPCPEVWHLQMQGCSNYQV